MGFNIYVHGTNHLVRYCSVYNGTVYDNAYF